MKQLSSYIENIQNRRFPAPCTLQFYIRPKLQQNDLFKLVKVTLSDNDIRKTVLALLKCCDLPTEYVENIPKQRKHINVFEINYKNISKLDPIFGPIVMQSIIKEERENESLIDWLKDNYLMAIEKSNINRPIRQDVEKLKKIVIEKVGVSKIIWDCGWNEMHFRGCLQSFIALAEQNPEPMHILKGIQTASTDSPLFQHQQYSLFFCTSSTVLFNSYALYFSSLSYFLILFLILVALITKIFISYLSCKSPVNNCHSVISLCFPYFCFFFC